MVGCAPAGPDNARLIHQGLLEPGPRRCYTHALIAAGAALRTWNGAVHTASQVAGCPLSDRRWSASFPDGPPPRGLARRSTAHRLTGHLCGEEGHVKSLSSPLSVSSVPRKGQNRRPPFPDVNRQRRNTGLPACCRCGSRSAPAPWRQPGALRHPRRMVRLICLGHAHPMPQLLPLVAAEVGLPRLSQGHPASPSPTAGQSLQAKKQTRENQIVHSLKGLANGSNPPPVNMSIIFGTGQALPPL